MDVRNRIVEAALGLLAEGGDLTQPRVAKAAGVRQSHLTYYFPTVTDLLQAVARHSFDKLAAEFGSGAARSSPSLADGIAKASRDKRRVRMMLGLVNAADRDASLKPRMRAFIQELRGRIAPMLKAGGLEATARPTSPSCTAWWSGARCCSSRATTRKRAARRAQCSPEP